MVMANVQTLLENADTPDLLNSVVNVILHIAKNYPNVFTSHFRVIIYILYISTDVSFYEYVILLTDLSINLCKLIQQ